MYNYAYVCASCLLQSYHLCDSTVHCGGCSEYHAHLVSFSALLAGGPELVTTSAGLVLGTVLPPMCWVLGIVIRTMSW